MQATLIKAQQEYQKVLLKLLSTTEPEERYWRRVQHWDSAMYLTRLKHEIVSLDTYLKKTPTTYLITEGFTIG